MKRYKAKIGSVSSGTMRPEDLIPAFVWELEHLKGGSKFRSLIRRANALPYDEWDAASYYRSPDHASEVLSELFDALNELAPPYTYFGAHEGDGADYGFWPDQDSILYFGEDLVRVNGEEELPKGYVGDYAVVNDHGNVSVYRKTKGHKSRLLWDCV